MAIKIEYDRICIGSFVLCEDANGVAFDGKAFANEFCDARKFQGESFGFQAGGGCAPVDATFIQRYPYASDTNATATASTLFVGCAPDDDRQQHGGTTSATHGFLLGGGSTRILKFSLATGADGTDSGMDGTISLSRQVGVTAVLPATGYSAGGRSPPGASNIIEKYPFSSDSNATDVGDLPLCKQDPQGHNDLTHGYVSGGYTSPSPANASVEDTERFPFASDANATDTGELVVDTDAGSGSSSLTHGYTVGGIDRPGEGSLDRIQKFPFASSTPTTDVGELTQGKCCVDHGSSSVTHGYTGGTSCVPRQAIEKFPFSADSPSSAVGNLARQGGNRGSGHQV